ncbi:MAG: PEP-CTERM sorting domain-containing protein [Deltaproteobacteria bacterium HGW-Deltaproteobacteria-12]|jgi:hypothetical protein|nr:MAG: PEP-CTERM sorting domain-containing protein [Deltaproteobacteria bacterium HGW-Deltaproteobacteria-12]
MKSSHIFTHFTFQRISILLIALAVFLMGLGQPALAGVYDTYRSWSYYTDSNGNTTSDDHFWTDQSLWQGSSSVLYNNNNYAKSWVGFGSGGDLGAKIGVSVNNSINEVYSSSYYRDDGFQCPATSCGTAVPLGGNFQMQLKQDGTFTLGTANFSLMYYLRTPSTAYNFHFAVQQGEMDLEPYGWFSRENLVTGQQTVKNIASNPSFFNLIWEDNNDDGIYNFSYDFSFNGNTNGVDFGEELNVSAFADRSSSGSQFVDSDNSFHANLTPDAGASFYRGAQLVVGNSGPQESVPEPATMLLLGFGLLGIAGARRKLKN